MRRSPGFLLLAVGLYLAGGIALLAAQENPPEVTPDTLESTTEGPAKAPLPLAQPQPTLSAPPPPFYHPPVIRELWGDFYRRLDGLEDGILTKKFVQALLDSLAESVQADFDSLAVRARAIEADEPGYTHKFYTSPLTRDEILGTPITEQEADDRPHFHAVYDPQGYLLRVRYVEPRQWRAKQQLLASGAYQSASTTPPEVRYFRDWDIRTLAGKGYVKKKKLLESQAHYRIVYDPEDEVEAVQYFDSDWKLVFTLTTGQASTEGNRYARLEFTDGAGSLLTLHPYLFLRDWSVVKPKWKVAITRDENGALASTQVFNQLDQLSYYYTFSFQEDEEAGTRTLRGTVLSDADEIKRVFALVYDKQDRMVRRAFYTNDGQLQEATTYDYLPATSELIATTRNAVGIVTSRQNFLYPAPRE